MRTVHVLLSFTDEEAAAMTVAGETPADFVRALARVIQSDTVARVVRAAEMIVDGQSEREGKIARMISVPVDELFAAVEAHRKERAKC